MVVLPPPPPPMLMPPGSGELPGSRLANCTAVFSVSVPEASASLCVTEMLSRPRRASASLPARASSTSSMP